MQSTDKQEVARKEEETSGVAISSSERRAKLMSSRLVQIGIGIVSFVIFLGFWQMFTEIFHDPIILSSPAGVFGAFTTLFSGNLPPGANLLPNIYTSIVYTLEVMAVAYVLVLTAIPAGIIMGRWKAAESIIDPWVNAVYAIPVVALIPILYFAIGASFRADVLIAFIVAFFTVLINVYTGVKYTSGSLAEIGRAFGSSERQFLTKIVLPASLPEIVAGLRLGAGRVALGAIVAEILLSGNSLGMLMLSFQMMNYTGAMMAVIIVIAIIGIITLQAPKLIERRYFKWKETEGLSRAGRR